jgi:hypothetical protein
MTLSPEEQRRITQLQALIDRHSGAVAKECFEELRKLYETKLTELGLSHAREKEEAREEGVRSVLLIRCTKHLLVAQQNASEITGAECGGCISEERDELKRRVEELEKKLAQSEQGIIERNAACSSLEAALKVASDALAGHYNRALDWDMLGRAHGNTAVQMWREDCGKALSEISRLTGAPKEG